MEIRLEDAAESVRREPSGPGGGHRIVVLGAGYAGVMAANGILATLDRRSRTGRRLATVTVVNPSADFIERIRLHEVAAGSRATAARPLSDVLHPAARLRTGTATRIDAARRTVSGAGWTLEYDSLVYATGSRAGAGVPGSREHAISVGDAAGALALRERIAGLRRGDAVSVIGGGLTGIETAAEIAERHRGLSVRLISSGPIMPGLATASRAYVARVLGRLGVTILEQARVSEVRAGEVRLSGGAWLPGQVCVWAASMTASNLARDSGLDTDRAGRLLVDHMLRYPGYPEIVAAGDSAAPPPEVAGHLRMSCAAALPLGSYAARAVLAAIGAGDGRPELAPLSVGYLIQCVSLGRSRGLIQPVSRDDTPRPGRIPGPAGAWLKEAVCQYTLRSMRRERRRPGSYRTVAGPGRAA